MLWDNAIAAGLDLISKIIPDPQAQADAKLKLLALQQAGEFKAIDAELSMALGQVEVNKVEASSESLFKSGWRPAVGWVCVGAFALKYMGGPAAFMIAQLTGHSISLPPIDMVEMMPILLGMLGLGAYRTYEKTKS